MRILGYKGWLLHVISGDSMKKMSVERCMELADKIMKLSENQKYEPEELLSSVCLIRVAGIFITGKDIRILEKKEHVMLEKAKDRMHALDLLTCK